MHIMLTRAALAKLGIPSDSPDCTPMGDLFETRVSQANYARLRDALRPGETYSDCILRLAQPRPDRYAR